VDDLQGGVAVSVKVILRVPTVGAGVGDEIEVADAKTADALVANGSAKRVKPGPKSDKD
jgi:hypothetical protein